MTRRKILESAIAGAVVLTNGSNPATSLPHSIFMTGRATTNGRTYPRSVWDDLVAKIASGGRVPVVVEESRDSVQVATNLQEVVGYVTEVSIVDDFLYGYVASARISLLRHCEGMKYASDVTFITPAGNGLVSEAGTITEYNLVHFCLHNHTAVEGATRVSFV